MALTDFTRPSARITARATGPRFSLWTALAVWQSRRALARLDARALDDIGVSAKCAASEVAKPIWDVPATWRN